MSGRTRNFLHFSCHAFHVMLQYPSVTHRCTHQKNTKGKERSIGVLHGYNGQLFCCKEKSGAGSAFESSGGKTAFGNG